MSANYGGNADNPDQHPAPPADGTVLTTNGAAGDNPNPVEPDGDGAAATSDVAINEGRFSTLSSFASEGCCPISVGWSCSFSDRVCLSRVGKRILGGRAYTYNPARCLPFYGPFKQIYCLLSICEYG